MRIDNGYTTKQMIFRVIKYGDENAPLKWTSKKLANYHRAVFSPEDIFQPCLITGGHQRCTKINHLGASELQLPKFEMHPIF